MNQDLQSLEIKVENDGTTPQGRLTAAEWNILVAAVKSLDLTGGSVDAASILQVVADAGYATQEWVTSQKYITSSALDNLAKNLVTLDTTQAITGMKDFTNGLKIGGVSVYKSKEGIVFVDGNLAVRGAITMYADNGQAAPSIWDGFPYDDITIKRNAAGKFYAVGGGGSGSGGLDYEMLDDYLTTNGYATQDWVTGRGYITGITGAMVTNALGYTPLSTTGTAASAYLLKAITGSSLVANTWDSSNGLSVSGWNSDGGWNTKYGTSLNISGFNTWHHRLGFNTNGVIEHWAAINTTTMSKVGDIAYVANIPTKLSQLNDDVFSGKVLALEIAKIGYGKANSWPLELFSTNSYTGIAFTCSDGTAHLRFMGGSKWGVTSAGWTATYDLLHSGNYSDYALPKDGIAVAAWKLANVRYLWGQLFDGTSNIGGQMSFNAGDFILAHNATDAWTDGNGLTHPWYGIDFRAGGSYKGYISHWSGISLVSGNDITLATDKNVVVSKGKLRINQSAFDNGLILNRTAANSGVGIVAMSNDVRLGTFGINGTKTFEISGDNGIVAQVSTETGNAMIIHGVGSYAEGIRLANRNGKTNTWSGIHLGCDPAQTTGTHATQWLVGRNGNNNYFVVRNNATDYLQIDLSGNLLIKGAFTMNYSSDERLKKNIRKVNASEVLMSLGGVWQYEYIDTEVQKNSVYNGTHFGLIYQNVKGKSLDKMCHKREDGMGALNYVDADFISIIAGATMENISEVEKLKRKIRTLENKVEQLEGRA